MGKMEWASGKASRRKPGGRTAHTEIAVSRIRPRKNQRFTLFKLFANLDRLKLSYPGLSACCLGYEH